MGFSDKCGTFWSFRAAFMPIIAFFGPLYLVVPLDEEELYSVIPKMPARCLYGIIVMAVLWVTEAIPISATALIPIFLFPMLGVAEAKTISGSYVSDTSMLFLGGLIVAVALEQSGLHRRISLGVMRIVGAQPVWLILGMMGTTWFLSMWISNTAATSMMIPIITAVIATVNDLNQGTDGGAQNQGYEPDEIAMEKQANGKKADKYEEPVPVAVPVRSQSRMSNEEFSRVAKALTLCVAWGANMGGIATITGTPPNLVLQGQANEFYVGRTGDPRADPDITFAKWMGFAFPLSLIGVLLAWLWLSLFFLRLGCFKKIDPETRYAINTTIRRQWDDLGRIKLSEIQVLIVFICLVVLWIFRKPPNIDGWGVGFITDGVMTVSDSTPCMLFSVLLFMLPAELPGVNSGTRYKPILNWEVVHQKLPWGVIVLLGGGFAIATASTESGFSKWMGNELTRFSDLEPWVMNLVLCSIVAGVTEVTSNTATATLLLPIFGELALATDSHPLYLMIGAAVSCSFAFMLPVATPPNAIVFSTKYITIKDMVIAGLPMNILAILTLTLARNTWGKSRSMLAYKRNQSTDSTEGRETEDSKYSDRWPANEHSGHLNAHAGDKYVGKIYVRFGDSARNILNK